MGTPKALTLKDLVEEVGVEEKYKDYDLSMEVSDTWNAKFRKFEAKHKASRELVIADILRENQNEKKRKQTEIEEEARKRGMDEYREYKRKNEKYDKWAYRKFEKPEEHVFLFGKMSHWIEGLRDYCKREDVKDDIAVKVLRHKAGSYIEDELEKIYSNNSSASESLDASLNALIEKCETQSDSWATITEFKNMKKKYDEKFVEFIDRVLDRAMYVPWGTKSKEDKEKEKLTVIYEGCDEISIQRIAGELRRNIKPCEDVNYMKLSEEAKLLDKSVAVRKSKGLIMKVEEVENRDDSEKQETAKVATPSMDEVKDFVSNAINAVFENRNSASNRGGSRHFQPYQNGFGNQSHGYSRGNRGAGRGFGRGFFNNRGGFGSRGGYSSRGGFVPRSGHNGSDRTYRSGRQCWMCDSFEHISRDCPLKTEWQNAKSNEQELGRDIEIIRAVITRKEKPKRAQVCRFIVAGVEHDFFVDSGAGQNVMKPESFFSIIERRSNESEWRLEMLATESAPLMVAFASNRPLQVIAAMSTIIAPIENKERKVQAPLYAVVGAQQDLMSHETATELGVLRIGYRECQDDIFMVSNQLGLDLAKEQVPFPKFPGFQLELDIDENIVPKCRFFEIVSVEQEQGYKRAVEESYRHDFIRPAPKGPKFWVSSAQAASKNHGKDVRLVINYVLLNVAVRVTFECEMPTLKSMMRFAQGKKFFAKLDIKSAFMHIELAPNSRKFSTFYTRWMLFEYTRMPMGLKIAPWVFQTKMQEILQPLGNGVIVYIDDILMGAETMSGLMELYNEVSRVLKQNNLQENKDKTVIGVEKIEIVGFEVTMDNISIPDNRLEVVKNLQQPTTLKLVKSLLGFFSFIGHHIPDFARISHPLWKMLREKKYVWGDVEERAFIGLKEAAQAHRILFHFDRDLPTYLITDAAEPAVGSCLFQIAESKVEKRQEIRVIGFASKLLPKTFKNYHQFEREIFGVVFALNHSREYLVQLKTNVIVLTDLRTAKIIIEKSLSHHKIVMKRFDRWMVSIQDIGYEIRWLAGNVNIADCVSRLSEIVSSSKGSDQFFKDYVAVLDDNEEKLTSHEIMSLNEVCTNCNVVQCNHFITCDEVFTEAKNDPDIIKAKNDLKEGREVDSMWKTHIKKLWVTKDDVLMRSDCIVLPKTLRRRAQGIAHRTHAAVETMVRLIKHYNWWPNMKKDVEELVKNCETCAMIRGKPSPAPMTPVPLPKGPLDHIAIDFADFPQLGLSVLVFVDYFSKYIILRVVRSKDFETVTKEMKIVFEFLGIPFEMRSDNGPPMNHNDWSSYFKKFDLKVEFSPPAHPQGDGLVERQMQRINAVLMSCWMRGVPPHEELAAHMRMHNATPSKVDKVSPHEKMFGRKSKVGLPIRKEDVHVSIDLEDIYEKNASAKRKMKEYGDNYNRARNSDIKIGDFVYIVDYKSGSKLTPRYMWDHETRQPRRFEVIDKKKNVLVMTDEKSTFTRDVSKVLKCPESIQEMLHDDIMNDFLSESPSRTEMAGIPTVMLKTMETNSPVITDEVQNAFDAIVQRQAENESAGRSRRLTAIKAAEETRKLIRDKRV